MNRWQLVQMLVGVQLIGVAVLMNEGVLGPEFTIIFTALMGGTLIGEPLIAAFFERRYARLDGLTRRYAPITTSHEDRRGQRVVVFAHSKKFREDMTALNKYVYKVQFSDGEECYAYRDELEEIKSESQGRRPGQDDRSDAG